MSTTIVIAFDDKFFSKEILTIDEQQVRCSDSNLTKEITGGDAIDLSRVGPSMRIPVKYLVVTVVKGQK